MHSSLLAASAKNPVQKSVEFSALDKTQSIKAPSQAYAKIFYRVIHHQMISQVWFALFLCKMLAIYFSWGFERRIVKRLHLFSKNNYFFEKWEAWGIYSDMIDMYNWNDSWETWGIYSGMICTIWMIQLCNHICGCVTLARTSFL